MRVQSDTVFLCSWQHEKQVCDVIFSQIQADFKAKIQRD